MIIVKPLVERKSNFQFQNLKNVVPFECVLKIDNVLHEVLRYAILCNLQKRINDEDLAQ